MLYYTEVERPMAMCSNMMSLLPISERSRTQQWGNIGSESTYIKFKNR